MAAKITDADAETLALNAIAFIMADEDLLPQFVALTGSGVDELRERLAEKAFLGGVLDFVLSDDATVIAFAESQGIMPETIMLARGKLPGWGG